MVTLSAGTTPQMGPIQKVAVVRAQEPLAHSHFNTPTTLEEEVGFRGQSNLSQVVNFATSCLYSALPLMALL